MGNYAMKGWFAMTKEETKTFEDLFRKYCNQEIKKGNCGADICDICSVNSAYNKIFNQSAEKENIGEDGEDSREI